MIHTATAQSIITIDVHENGDAVWTMEEYLPLANQNEIDEWDEFIQSRESTEQYQYDIEEFQGRIEGFVYLAEVSSNRSMDAENYTIYYDTLNTISGAFGIVRFSFKWKNFSITDSNKILIGDVFSEGMILSSDNVLTIKIPDGYKVTSVSPDYDRRDGKGLIWEGTVSRNFDKGEPALVLKYEENGPGIWTVAIFVLLAGASVLVWKRRKTLISDIKSHTDPILNSATNDFLEDEELIEQILKKSGGQEYQSEIVKQSAISKSKVSIVLTKMNNDGKIIKIKKGKGNIIRLVKEKSE
ncbi:MAG: hypothetical protein P1P80_06905 [ANME-2 cluster archaeon]|nr:hypothetical protein [ANME-2 cluster archaeon]